MVLADLGGRIQRALRTMSSSTVVDEEVVTAMVKEIQKALLESDVNVRQVSQISKEIKRNVNPETMPPGANRRNLVKKAVFDSLTTMLDSGKEPFQPQRGKPNVIMFVGLQGSGKTTSCVKLAHYYQRKRFKTCLVCADTFRAGAYDQLRQNAARANIPYYGSYTERDPVRVAEEGVEMFKEEKFEVIIVDTSGRHKQEAALFEEMEQVSQAVQPDNIIFTMDGSIGQAAIDQARAFKESVPVGSVIITKLDGHAKGGGALSAVAATQSPIVFIGTGEHMTDFEAFEAKSFVSRLLGMGDLKGLMRAMEDANIGDQKEVMEKIMKGGFNLRMMRDQLQNIMSLGPMSQVVGMIPGLGQLFPKGKDQESGNRLKTLMTLMDSMTDQELDSQDLKVFNESRNKRIAQGSGCSLQDLNQLFAMYKPFKKVLDKMKGMGKGRGAQGMPNARQLQSMMNPEMLKQMGGVSGLQNMMKQMGGKGGMGGMGNMFQ